MLKKTQNLSTKIRYAQKNAKFEHENKICSKNEEF